MHFDESKHPRDKKGRFSDKGESDYSSEINKRIRWAKDSGIELPLNSDGSVDDLRLQKLYETKKSASIKVNMDADIQKQFDAATPRERTKIALNYIMENLRGKYAANDGRVIAIERVGAKEITHTLFEPKIRVTPELANLIEAGNLINVKNAEHTKFKKFAYYAVGFQIKNDVYRAVINVGIRDDGSSTLYDINQFVKEK